MAACIVWLGWTNQGRLIRRLGKDQTRPWPESNALGNFGRNAWALASLLKCNCLCPPFPSSARRTTQFCRLQRLRRPALSASCSCSPHLFLYRCCTPLDDRLFAPPPPIHFTATIDRSSTAPARASGEPAFLPLHRFNWVTLGPHTTSQRPSVLHAPSPVNPIPTAKLHSVEKATPFHPLC